MIFAAGTVFPRLLSLVKFFQKNFSGNFREIFSENFLAASGEF